MKRAIVTLAVLLTAVTTLPAWGFANPDGHDPRLVPAAQPAFAYPGPPVERHPFYNAYRPRVAYPSTSRWVWTPGTWYWNGVAWAWYPGRWALESRPGF